MFRASPSALVGSFALLASACGGSSGGGGSDPHLAVEALRHELFASGIHPLPAPPPVSDELFALGQALFFDKVLSGNEDVSCATCHVPQFFTSDGRTLPRGVNGIGLGPSRGGGTMIPRNSPMLLALHVKRVLFWDGRVQDHGDFISTPGLVISEAMRAVFSPGLETMAAQAMMPPLSRGEMRGQPGENPLGDLIGYNSIDDFDIAPSAWEALTERLLDLPGYVALLQAAYPDVAIQDFNFAYAGNAIAAFEARAFARTDSPFERFVRGDDQALTARQVAGGLEFFGPAGCAHCHSGSLFSDQDHHNIGLPQLGPGVADCQSRPCPGDFFTREDLGRQNVTLLLEDRYKFRTPSLLDVELTAPYGHAGQFAKLRDFVAHYRDVALSNRQYDIQSNVFDPELVTTLVPNSELVLANLDQRLQAPIDFDVDAVVEFLRALTAEDAKDLSDVVPASVPSGLPIL